MEIAIRSRHVELPADVRALVQEKIGHLGRFPEGTERAEVCFSEERNPRISEPQVCEATLVGHGHVVRAKAAGAETLVAVDRVVAKLEHRLEKLKGRLVGRSHPRHHGSDPTRAPVVDLGGPALVEAVDEEAEDGDARIVKVKQFAIKPMTPEEASLQMELLSHDFFLFTNAETGRAAVVYQRGDGHIGLIDSA